MKISVCIPLYNVEAFIERCARSLFEQTYEDLEFIFVDDCSPDGSLDILKRVLADYPARRDQVKIIRHDHNRGLIVARQTAMAAATGDFLAHCDSDDWVDADLYATLAKAQQADDLDVAISSIVKEFEARQVWLNAEDGEVRTGLSLLAEYTADRLVTPVFNKLIRRALVDTETLDLPSEIALGEDICFNVQVLGRAARVRKVAGPAYHYRINAASMTKQVSAKKVLACFTPLYEIVSRVLPSDVSAAIRAYLARSVLFWGVVDGMLTVSDFALWRQRLSDAGGAYSFEDYCHRGRLLLALARVSLPLARTVAPILRSRINDTL